MGTMARIALLGSVLIMAAAGAERDCGTGAIELSGGYWAGNTTYRIGGEAWTPETGPVRFPDKISELEFPLEVGYVELGMEWRWPSALGVHGSVLAAFTDPIGKMRDSDWDLDGQLWVYSESVAELEAWTADVGMRYWFGPPTKLGRAAWRVGLGPGVLFNRLDWTIRDTTQTYPLQPWLGTQVVTGRTLTYGVDLSMWYVDAVAELDIGRFSGRIELANGIVVGQDKDDHLLRSQMSTTDLAGVGLRATLEARVALGEGWFAAVRASALVLDAVGTSHVRYYGGEDAGWRGEIEEEVSARWCTAGVVLGYTF